MSSSDVPRREGASRAARAHLRARAVHDVRAWPTTRAGRASLSLATAFATVYVWVMLLDPLVSVLRGRDENVSTVGRLPSLLMVALVDAAAVAGLVARRRGERAPVAQVVLWGTVLLAVLWTAIIGGSVLTNR